MLADETSVAGRQRRGVVPEGDREVAAEIQRCVVRYLHGCVAAHGIAGKIERVVADCTAADIAGAVDQATVITVPDVGGGNAGSFLERVVRDEAVEDVGETHPEGGVLAGLGRARAVEQVATAVCTRLGDTEVHAARVAVGLDLDHIGRRIVQQDRPDGDLDPLLRGE